MPATTTIMHARDGRALDVLVGGSPAGPALIAHHGTPADATLWAGWDAASAKRNLRLIAISRPGYAGSTRRAGRTVADVVEDVADVADALAVPWFVAAGWSGGGPHAIACGALLTDRCRAVATLAGVGPYGASGLDFLAGMGPENHAEFGAALDGQATLRTWLETNAEELRHVSAASLVAAFGGLIPPVDAATLNAGFAGGMAASIKRALSAGFDGWIDDDIAFIEPWGFDLSAIAAPITVWQGDVDLMVPAAHGAWLERHIPTAVKRDAPGHGHISLMAGYRDAILDDLLAHVV